MQKRNCILNFIDIFGTKFHLFMNQKLKFKTWVGGIITIFSLIMGITFIFIFGQDFFFRQHPSYTQTTVGEEYKRINLTKEKVVIAFRTEDVYGNYLDTSNYIFPKIYYYSAIPSEDGEFRNNYKEEYISYRMCDSNDFEGNENFISLYGELYCIEWKNKTFGGYWDHEFLYYFEIRLFYCNNSENYSYKNNSKCSTIEELNKYFSINTVYFSIYYTNVDFRVNDLKNPLSRSHSNYFTFISHNFRKTDRIYLGEQILNDDQGWVLNENKNISIWGGNNIKSDYDYFDNEKLTTEGFSSMFYSLNIYMTSNKYYYTRKYKKLPDILSMIGGLITFIRLFGKTLNVSINLSMKKLKIIEMLFEFKDDDEKTKSFNSENTINNSKLNLINPDNSMIANKKCSKNDNYQNSLLAYNKKYLFKKKDLKNNNKINEKHNLNYQIKNKNDVIIEINKIEIKEEKINKKQFPQKIVNLIIKNDLKKLLICNSKNKRKNIYYFINEIFNEKCDLFNYFNSLKDIRFIKQIFFNPNQLLAFDFTKKLTINLNDSFNSFIGNQYKKHKLIEYFRKRFKSKKNSHIDNYIFEQLEQDIQNKIKMK